MTRPVTRKGSLPRAYQLTACPLVFTTQALISGLQAIETTASYAAKQTAFDELQPLIWRQVLAQAQRFYTFMAKAHDLDVVSIKEVRADEQLNGWLNIRTCNTVDTQVRARHASLHKARRVDADICCSLTRDSECVPADYARFFHRRQQWFCAALLCRFRCVCLP